MLTRYEIILLLLLFLPALSALGAEPIASSIAA